MLLAIDIGNTAATFGVFDGPRLIGTFRFSSRQRPGLDECDRQVRTELEGLSVRPGDIDRVVIGSVVPRLTESYTNVADRRFGTMPLVVTGAMSLPIKLAYDDPVTLGADRIANAVAAFAKLGGPIIVVDYGTAITFDVVTGDGIFWGGIIIAGPELAGKSLAQNTGQLPEITPEKPSRIIGRNTGDAIKSGIYYGIAGQVDTLITMIRQELNSDTRVIATGGWAEMFAPLSDFIESSYKPLTLEGLRLIAEYQERQ
ncbi:MAG: type III pantothenate kinase [candidate division Zixibacteria bacterium]|nr:type III pantothenate kinase [candidate division Zixibacteria bacterium]